MGNITVGMADLKVGRAPDVIITVGLGSCIGLTLYDPITKIGGMVHYMLPDSTAVANQSNIAKFADTGIQELLNQMLKAGANRRSLVAKIAGGAKMFAVNQMTSVGSVGQRNAIAARQMLMKLNINLVAQDTGLNYGRTVELHCDTGDFHIRAVKKPVKII